MVLNKYRSSFDKILTPMAKAFSGLHPNTISAVSLIFALLAGIAFVYSNESAFEDRFNPGHYIYIMFAIASICIFLNGLLDAVDGHVARLTKRTTKRGDLFDHALDRYADILILGGIMLSPYCDTVLGALAIIAVLLTSYMGTQAQALGCGRDYSGLLGRADRLVILIIAPLLQMGVNYFLPSGRLPLPGVFRLTILEYIMIWFFIAGNITAIHRAIHSWRELRDLEKPQKTIDQFYTFMESQRKITTPNPRSTKYIDLSKPKPEAPPVGTKAPSRRKELPKRRTKLKLKAKERKPPTHVKSPRAHANVHAPPKRKRKVKAPEERPEPTTKLIKTAPDEKPLKLRRKTKPAKLKTKTKPSLEPTKPKKHRLKSKSRTRVAAGQKRRKRKTKPTVDWD